MKRVLTCDCGQTFDHSDEKVLLAAARAHALEAHALDISVDQLLALSRSVVPEEENGAGSAGR